MTRAVDLQVSEAKPGDAPDVVDIVHAAFGARPPLDPPGTAMSESVGSVQAALAADGGLIARVDGEPAGAVLFSVEDGWLGLRRVSVHPRFQQRGVATALVGCAEDAAARQGLLGVRLGARAELPATVEFWRRRGYVVRYADESDIVFVKPVPYELTVPTVEDMHRLGERLAGVLRAGDLVLLAGDLGAGKTTLTQGLGEGLGVTGSITSPTFVISRVHSSPGDGPMLVHVDAYRLGAGTDPENPGAPAITELDDLDLDASLEEAVTVVEWGEGIAEDLADERLELVITRSLGQGSSGRAGPDTNGPDTSGPDTSGADGSHATETADEGDHDSARQVRVTGVGHRWLGVDLRLDG